MPKTSASPSAVRRNRLSAQADRSHLHFLVASTNIASKRILEKNGFVQTGSETIDDLQFGVIELLNLRLD